MTTLDALDEMTRYPAPNAAAARFFLRIGQAGRAAAPKDEMTLPLFGLPLILEAEGLLAQERSE